MTSDSPRKPLMVGHIGVTTQAVNAALGTGECANITKADAVIIGERGTMSLDPHNPDDRSEPSYTTEPCMCGECKTCRDRDIVEYAKSYSRQGPYAAAMGMALCSDMLDRPAFRRRADPPRADKALLKAKCLREGCDCSKTPGRPYCSPECAHIDRINKKKEKR